MIKPSKRKRRRTKKSGRPQWLQPRNSGESQGWTSHYERVTRTGLQLPKVDQVSAGELPDLLASLIAKLADLQVFLMFTDHLSDGELYRQLTEEALHDRIQDIPPTADMAYVVGLIGHKREHLTTYLEFYASAEERRQLTKNAPSLILPPRRDPPYDRDRFLPGPGGV